MTATASARDNRRRQEKLAAAARAREAAARRRRRQIVGGAVALVLVAVGAMLGIAAMIGGSSSTGSDANAMADADGTAIAQMLIATPAETVSSIGVGSVKRPPTAVHDGALTSDGKPEILYLGANYCPYCAAERWPLVLALSRFGTFSQLGLTTSAHDDVFPDTATFSFHDMTYRSDYLSFVARELYTNQRDGSHYGTLDKATDAESALLARYGGSFPFIDFAGRYVQGGASYDPSVLQGMSADDIAMAVANPQSAAAQGIAGTANVLTATICEVTSGQPTNVCTDPAVVVAAKKLHG